MQKRMRTTDLLAIVVLIVLVGITLTGVLSFDATKSYEVVNQYGDTVRIFGSGIYRHDSYFKAPINIGSDCTMLLLAVPLLIVALVQERKRRSVKARLFLISVTGTILYYAASIAFGVTYNAYHLLYIALFAGSFFMLIALIRGLDMARLQRARQWRLPAKGVSAFLIVSGIGLFVAWMPDILTSLFAGRPLQLIEVYTTEITYVLDMGLIAPLMFVCLFLLKKKDGLGDVLLAILLQLCVVIGVMLPLQTLFQTLAGIQIPVPALITKVGIFVVLAAFALHFYLKLLKSVLEPAVPFEAEGIHHVN